MRNINVDVWWNVFIQWLTSLDLLNEWIEEMNKHEREATTNDPIYFVINMPDWDYSDEGYAFWEEIDEDWQMFYDQHSVTVGHLVLDYKINNM